LIAWRKLKQRNIAPILDASGWAINGNVKIPTLLGDSLTKLPIYPVKSFLRIKDPYANKKFPKKRFIAGIIIVVVLVIAIIIIKNPNGINGVWQGIKSIASKFKFSK
jgi:hypothetical protein